MTATNEVVRQRVSFAKMNVGIRKDGDDELFSARTKIEFKVNNDEEMRFLAYYRQNHILHGRIMVGTFDPDQKDFLSGESRMIIKGEFVAGAKRDSVSMLSSSIGIRFDVPSGVDVGEMAKSFNNSEGFIEVSRFEKKKKKGDKKKGGEEENQTPLIDNSGQNDENKNETGTEEQTSTVENSQVVEESVETEVSDSITEFEEGEYEDVQDPPNWFDSSVDELKNTGKVTARYLKALKKAGVNSLGQLSDVICNKSDKFDDLGLIRGISPTGVTELVAAFNEFSSMKNECGVNETEKIHEPDEIVDFDEVDWWKRPATVLAQKAPSEDAQFKMMDLVNVMNKAGRIENLGDIVCMIVEFGDRPYDSLDAIPGFKVGDDDVVKSAFDFYFHYKEMTNPRKSNEAWDSWFSTQVDRQETPVAGVNGEE